MPRKKELIRKHFRVAIFGSARIKSPDPEYKQVFRLAKMIASVGIDIVTGGGPGLMDAASKGHH
ncbi:MAG: LOG family protein, partial [Candidatus Nanoarchaeia archaeon]